MQVKLKVVHADEPGEVGKEFTLDQPGTVIVGRKDAKNVEFRVCATDIRFSRYHFMLEATNTACYVQDMGSCNGTFVNGKPLGSRKRKDSKQNRYVKLKDGDLIHSANKKRFVQFLVSIDPLAGANFPEIPEDSGSGLSGGRDGETPEPPDDDPGQPSDVGDMITWPIGRSASRSECPVCRATPPEDGWLRDLLKTGMTRYVCTKHCKQLTDSDHPIPGYEVLDVLGNGTVGPVYKARNTSSGKLAILKVVPERLTSNKEVMKIFQRFMRLSVQLRQRYRLALRRQSPQHDDPAWCVGGEHIAHVTELGQVGEQLWLATEFVEGIDAERLVKSLHGRLPMADAVDITCQALSALHCLHRVSLVHRDVKPSNILVSGTAGKYVAKLADFMLVKNTEETPLTVITGEDTGDGPEKRGTVAFMPPEQVKDSRCVKAEADIYGAAATLYWLLTGEFVYDFTARDKTGEVKNPFLIILDDRVIPIRQRNPAVPEGVARVIESALHRDPEERIRTAGQMAAKLRTEMAAGNAAGGSAG